MPRPNTPNTPYTQKEIEYIYRVAGRVPSEVMAKAIGKTKKGLRNWASRHGISLLVPYSIILKHWPEYAERGGYYGGQKETETSM